MSILALLCLMAPNNCCRSPQGERAGGDVPAVAMAGPRRVHLAYLLHHLFIYLNLLLLQPGAPARLPAGQGGAGRDGVLQPLSLGQGG